MAIQPDHIHRADDGRGNRDVFLNGTIVNQVYFVDEKKGIVRRFRGPPIRIDKRCKRPLCETLHGTVVVTRK
jgi:hypothetical protein